MEISNYDSVLETAIKRYGLQAQKMMAVEECAEFLNSIAKLDRGRATPEDVIDEIADVTIMMHIGQDIRYVSGDMTNEEMERHRRYHHELSVQNENGLHDWEKYDKPAY